MKSKPAGIQQQRPLASQIQLLQPRGDGPSLAVQLVIGEMDLLGLAVDQVDERPVVRLMRGTMLNQVDQIRRTEKRSGQMIQMHGYPDLYCWWRVQYWQGRTAGGCDAYGFTIGQRNPRAGYVFG